MKKSILNLGKALSKAEQQTINGGNFSIDPGMDEGKCKCWFYQYPEPRICLSFHQTCSELNNSDV
jgi:hypothetical protein